MGETKCPGLRNGFCCAGAHVNYSACSEEEVRDCEEREGSERVAATTVATRTFLKRSLGFPSLLLATQGLHGASPFDLPDLNIVRLVPPWASGHTSQARAGMVLPAYGERCHLGRRQHLSPGGEEATLIIS